jgi:O-antigen ligase
LYFFGTNVLDTVLTDYLIVAQLFQIALVLAVLQKENILKYFAIIIFSVSILLLGARAIILTSALIPVLLLSKQFKIKFKHVAIISVFMIILLANFQTILKPLFQYSMDRLFLLADFTGDVSAMERVSQYQFVIEHYINEPSKYLHGYGFGSFGQEYFNKDIRSHPHNLFLETLFELGFLGFMVLLTFLFVVFRKFSKTYWKNDKTYRILCVVLILLFINAMKSSSLDGQRDLFCFVALFLLKTYHLKYNVDVAPLT